MKTRCQRLWVIVLAIGLPWGALAKDLSITSISLVKPKTEEPLSNYDPLFEGAVIDLAALGDEISIRINPESSDDVGSIRCILSGPAMVFRTEEAFPWSFFGNGADGPFSSKRLPVGSYTLTCVPYVEANCQGIPGEKYTIKFTVVERIQEVITPLVPQEEVIVENAMSGMGKEAVPESSSYIPLPELLAVAEEVTSQLSPAQVLILLVSCGLILIPGIILIMRVSSARK